MVIKIVGNFIYYDLLVDSTMLVTLTELDGDQSQPYLPNNVCVWGSVIEYQPIFQL